MIGKKELLARFSDLVFDDPTHTYTIDGEVYPSVSSIIKKFYKRPDFKMVAKFTAKKYNKTVEEVLDNWKAKNEESIVLGNNTHNFAEDYINGLDVKPETLQQQAAVEFIASIQEQYEVIATELQMFCRKRRYAGTADLILRNKQTGGIVIADWKTNKDLFKNYKGTKMLSPFNFLLDNPFNHYQLQFSLYQILLEDENLKVEDRILIHLRRDGTYESYNTVDYTDKLKLFLDDKQGDNTESSEPIFSWSGIR